MPQFFKYWLIISLIFYSIHAALYAQCPDASFSVNKSQFCQNENLDLTNNSINAETYYWNFCSNDLNEIPDQNIIIPDLENSSQPIGFQTVEYEGNWYGLITNRGNGNILRVEYGSNLSNPSPIVNNLGNPDNQLSLPEDIEILKVDGNWYALVTQNLNSPNNNIILVEFGPDLLNPDPSATNLGNFGIGTKIRGLTAGIDNDEIIVLITKSDRQLVIVNFRDSFYNTVDGSNIITTPNIATNTLFDVGIYEECGHWYGAGPANNNLSLFDFGTSLFSIPSVSNYSFPEISNVAFDADFISDGDSTYVVIGNLTNPYTLINLGNLPNGDIPTLVDPSPEINPSLSSLSINAFEGIFIVSGVTTIRELHQINYIADCGESIRFSNDENPSNIFYSQAGNHNVSLTTTNNNQVIDHTTEYINITNDVAPDVLFEINTVDRCINTTIDFLGNSPEAISKWNWSFGNGDSSFVQNPSYTYTASGIYDITLFVESTNECTNRYNKTIEIFEEPVPDFQATAQGSICSQKPIIFENLTTLPTEATFSWDLGDGSTSTEENPEHVYAEAGDYTVVQTINMAGCTVEKTKTITVNPGPAVAFQTSNNCLGEILQFENTSQGDFLDSYQWDFGDGSQSTQANPSHLYDTAGVYEVQLSAFTTNGCDFTITQQVEIQPLATIDFLSDVACVGQPTQFTEQVTVDQSNITDYLWNFGVAGTQSDVSTEANPQFAFPSSGTYNVSLQVTTSDGCTSRGSKSITVNTAPEAAFEFDETCLNQARLFTPLDTTNIISHFWELQNSQGEIVESSQSTHFSYLFAEVGTYQLTYRQENENLCSQSTTQTLSINEQPIPDFGWSTACVGEALQLNNLTDLNGNTLKNYKWSIEEEIISTDTHLQYTFEESGEYTVRLEVETLGGCVQNISKTIPVSPAPSAFFELEQNVGAYPFELSLNAEEYQVSSIESLDGTEYSVQSTETADTTNLSTRQLVNLATYFWTLNGDTISTTSELNHIIEEAGTYLLGLLLTNDAGCTDEHYKQIKVKEPNLDVSLSNLRVNKDDEFTSFILNINNRGSLVPERIDLAIDLGSYSVTESLETPLYPEQNRNFSLSLKLTDDQLKGLSKICINANPRAGVHTDSNTQNNRICINLESGFKVMEIFPNPAVNQFTIPVITPEQDKLTISMEDSNGRQVKVFNYDLEAGYNELRIHRERLSPGIYFLRFRYQGQEKVKKIIFQ